MKKDEKIKTLQLCKGYFNILEITHYIFVRFEKIYESCYDFYYSNDSGEIDAIATKAFKESGIMEELFNLDKRYFKDICVDGDDCVEGKGVTDDMLDPDETYTYAKVLAKRIIEVEFEGKTYKCYVELCREWFDNEEHKNIL